MKGLESIQVYSRPGEITIYFDETVYVWKDEHKKIVTDCMVAAIMNGEMRWYDEKHLGDGCIICHYNPTKISERDAQRGAKRIIEAIRSTEFQMPRDEISELSMSVRTTNCLHIKGIHLLDELTEMTEEELGKIRNMGPKQVQEVVDCLQTRGLSLRKEEM